MQEENIKLENGLTVYYKRGLDGGGSTQRHDFMLALDKNEKKYFNRVYEWCAGPGYIGFNVLDRNMSEHIVFSDSHEPAIDFIKITAERNNIKNKVTTYHCDEINKIPLTEKWDLVLANPPHCFYGAEISYLEDKNDPTIPDLIRILEDKDYKIHREFFKNIALYLEPNADLYITQVHENDVVKKMAIEGKLTFVGFHHAPTLAIHSGNQAGVLHFKYIV